MDLRTNQRVEGGYSKCHGGRDLLLSATGDLALVENERENLFQRLALWAVTPKGELTDPRAGCALFAYRHAKLTNENMLMFAGEMLSDLRYSFPEWSIKGVQCNFTYETGNRINRNGIVVSIELAEETLELMIGTDVPEDAWLGAKSFLRYKGLSARTEGPD